MLEFRQIAYESESYHQAVALRQKILREPLGLILTPEELEEDKQNIHLAGYKQDQLVVCSLLRPLPELLWVKLRQFAVAEAFQRQGIGGQMLAYAERVAIQHRYRGITLSARETALLFYRKHGYAVEGERFIQQTIPHWKMAKLLSA